LNLSEFALQTSACLHKVCIAFSVRVSLEFVLGLGLGYRLCLGLPYCNSKPSHTGKFKIAVCTRTLDNSFPDITSHLFFYFVGTVALARSFTVSMVSTEAGSMARPNVQPTCVVCVHE